MAPQLGGVLARELVQVDSSVCRTDRGCYLSRFLASYVGRYVVFSAVGAVDLYSPSCRCIAYKPVPSASLFSIVAAFICCPSERTYAADNWCHSHDVLFAARARLFRQEGGLTKRWSAYEGCQSRSGRCFSFLVFFVVPTLARV